MKRKINKYDPVIYPRLLWVTNRIEDLDEADNGKYRMEIYNKAGKKSSTYYFDLDYSGMTADDDEVILYNDEVFLNIYYFSL